MMIQRFLWLMVLALMCTAPAHAVAQQDPGGGSGSAEASPKEHLGKILKRPIYNRWRLRQERADSYPSSLGRSVEEQLRSFGRWLEKNVYEPIERWFNRKPKPKRRFDNSDRSGSFTFAAVLKVAGWVLLAIALVFVGIAIYRLIADSRHRGKRARVLGREHIRAALEAGDALALDSGAWLSAAEDLSAEGDLRAVYRALYLALLSGLHSARKIDFRRNRTNWFYVRQFRGADEERTVFHDLTLLFDRVWYGIMPSTIGAIAPLKTSMARLLETGARDA